MTLGTMLFIKFFCNEVGKDQFGNVYYQSKTKDSNNRCKRIVMYKEEIEGSKIPALWNAWLHYSIDGVPSDRLHYKWEKSHISNKTGTEDAYYPSGYFKSAKEKNNNKVINIYQAWQPSNIKNI